MIVGSGKGDSNEQNVHEFAVVVLLLLSMAMPAFAGGDQCPR